MHMNRIIQGDSLEVLCTLPDDSVQCVVTSPPYWGLRDYGVDGQLGLEKSPEEYTAKMTEVFRECRRVLKADGTLWLNLGDSYASDQKGSSGPSEKQLTNAGSRYEMNQRLNHGLKPKDLCGIPWRIAFALQADGWYLRSDIIWNKPNPMPESVTDRPTKAHEYVFLLSRSEKYFYDAAAIAEPATMSTLSRLSQPNLEIQAGSNRVPGKTNGPMKAVGRIDKQRGHSRRHAGFNDRWDSMEKEEQCSMMRNKRDVWTIATTPYKDAHFAVMPTDLARTCILAGSRPSDIVLDPFMGAGTVALVAKELNRKYLGIELNPAYIEMAQRRLRQEVLEFA